MLFMKTMTFTTERNRSGFVIIGCDDDDDDDDVIMINLLAAPMI